MDEPYKHSAPSARMTPSARHRRQMLWQVWTPLVAGILIFLALGILSIIGATQGNAQVERWANISAVWVIIPVLLSSLLILALVGGIAYGVTVLLKKMPGWLLTVQLFMLRIALVTRRAADKATTPVVTVNTLSARVSTLWNKLFHRRATP